MTVPQAAIDAGEQAAIAKYGVLGDRNIVRADVAAVLEAAAPHIAAAERERIIALANHHGAKCLAPPPGGDPIPERLTWQPFADMLTEGEPDGS